MNLSSFYYTKLDELTLDGDIPLFFKTASGNKVDSSYFGEIAIEYKNQIQLDSLIVADCALYTEANLKLMSEMKWLSLFCHFPVILNKRIKKENRER